VWLLCQVEVPVRSTEVALYGGTWGEAPLYSVRHQPHRPHRPMQRGMFVPACLPQFLPATEAQIRHGTQGYGTQQRGISKQSDNKESDTNRVRLLAGKYHVAMDSGECETGRRQAAHPHSAKWHLQNTP